MKNSNDISFNNNGSIRIINTPSPSAKSTFFYIQETGCLKKEDAAASQRKNLESYLIVAVASGRGELTIEDVTYTLSKGECFFIDCRKPHNYKGSDDDPWELLWIHFNGAASDQYYNLYSSQSKPVFCPSGFDRIVSAINRIIEINKKNVPEAEILTSKYLVDILTLALTSAVSPKEFDSALMNKLSDVHTYISENFTKDISLELLSSKFYISKFYLTREYKRIYGMTIFQHLINTRINHGKMLLRFTNHSIEEIAHLCGFNDQSYFARQFKKAENQTCFSYRKKWRDGIDPQKSE